MGLLAQDIMTKDPVSATEDTPLGNALEILLSLDIRHLPIVNRAGELVGMVSDRDLRGVNLPVVPGMDPSGRGKVALNRPVSTVMSSDVISVDTEAELQEVIELMLENKVGAIPVTDPEGELVGIISYVDVLRQVQGSL
ncbi:MAG: CBS domain-containing protein [Myxococcota bacterium]